MRAPRIVLALAASLCLANCSSIRTVNGYDTVETKSFCEVRLAVCVLGAVAVVGAGAAVGVAASGSRKNNTGDAAFALFALQSGGRGGTTAAGAGGTTTVPTTITTPGGGTTPVTP